MYAKNNTKGFLNFYSKLLKSQKKIVLSELLFLKEIDKKIFLSRLNKIKDKGSYKNAIEEIQSELFDK